MISITNYNDDRTNDEYQNNNIMIIECNNDNNSNDNDKTKRKS